MSSEPENKEKPENSEATEKKKASLKFPVSDSLDVPQIPLPTDELEPFIYTNPSPEWLHEIDIEPILEPNDKNPEDPSL